MGSPSKSSDSWIHCADALPGRFRDVELAYAERGVHYGCTWPPVVQLNKPGAFVLVGTVVAVASGDVVWQHLDRLLCGDKLRPDGLPVSRAQVAQPGLWVDLVPTTRQRRAGDLDAFGNLVEVLLVNIELSSDKAAVFWCVNWKCHSAYSSQGLAVVKPLARFIYMPSD